MKTIKTSIIIQASAEHVWTILTNLDAYADWNPYIVLARGDLVTPCVRMSETTSPKSLV